MVSFISFLAQTLIDLSDNQPNQWQETQLMIQSIQWIAAEQAVSVINRVMHDKGSDFSIVSVIVKTPDQ